MSLEMCATTEENLPCCHDHSNYSAHVIQKLRMYFATLPHVDQRLFVSPGVRCTLADSRIAKGGDLSNVRLHRGFSLEKPDILEQRLTDAIASKKPMQTPVATECDLVCQKFLLWALGRSLTWFNQPDRKHKSREYQQGPEDRVFQTQPIRQGDGMRVALKSRYVTDWLTQQKKEHLVLPNESATILPYKDRREAHASFVLEAERRLVFEHREASIDLVYSDGLSKEEEGRHNPDEEQGERQGALAAAVPERSRYGNIVLGAKGAVPECSDIAGFTWFCSVWRSAEDGFFRRTCKMRKWMPFAKCDACAKHRQAMAATKDPEEMSRLNALHREHLERVKRERLSYVMRQRLSIMNPTRYLSLIIDGADSSSMQLPHLAERSHISDACPKIKMHVLGCIAHGRDTYAYTCPPHIAQGHNITIQVLHRVLHDIKTKEGAIPPILHLQLDNTTKQNKGRFLMAYLAYLVQQGVIKEAYCNFLPVGHTHEDIDQFFSRFAMYCRRHNAPDLAALLECLRKCYTKNGKAPLVEGWSTVANTSEYFARYTHPGLSKDITLYYQLRIIMGRGLAIAGVPIMQARTWPGAAGSDPNDYWRGLLPDTSYVLIFKNKPSLHSQRDSVPTQQQPMHIDSNPSSDVRAAYTSSLEVQRAMIEKLMEHFPGVFTNRHITNMRHLMDALASNLEMRRPVTFDWPQSELDYLYAQGQYVEHAPQAVLQEMEVAPDPNLFEDEHVLHAQREDRPNGLLDPQGFQEALRRGHIDLLQVENVTACVLVVGNFYLQRPHALGKPFDLVKVVKVILDDEGLQWGAWVHPWEVSTAEPHQDYYLDPWHASGLYKDSTRYNHKLGPNNQSAAWNYPKSILSEFQFQVPVNKKWHKPAEYTKVVVADRGVLKRNIQRDCVPKLRNFVHRWNEAEGQVQQ